MSLEQSLYDFLANDAGVYAIIGQGGSPAQIALYPQHGDESITPPYAVYLRAGGHSENDLAGAGLANTRMQIDAYAETAAGARDLALAINKALDGVAIALPVGRVAFTRISVLDMPEPDVRLYRRMQEYSIWHPET